MRWRLQAGGSRKRCAAGEAQHALPDSMHPACRSAMPSQLCHVAFPGLPRAAQKSHHPAAPSSTLQPTLMGAWPRTHMAMPKASAHSRAHSAVRKLNTRQACSRQSWVRVWRGAASAALVPPRPGAVLGRSSARSFMSAGAGCDRGSRPVEPAAGRPPLPGLRHRAGGRRAVQSGRVDLGRGRSRALKNG